MYPKITWSQFRRAISCASLDALQVAGHGPRRLARPGGHQQGAAEQSYEWRSPAAGCVHGRIAGKWAHMFESWTMLRRSAFDSGEEAE